MKPDRPRRGLALLLAALSALGPFSIDAYLPSFHDIGLALSATPLQVQQTLTAYLLPFAFMSLWHGSISDALGRRRVILWALVLFGLTSLGCALVTQIEQLWILRAAQGTTAGVGVVVGRAIVRDLFDGPLAQKMMAHVSMTFAFAPALAPLIGGWLHSLFGWRSVFYFLALFTALLFCVSWRFLPETLPPEKRQSLQFAYLGRAYCKVLTCPPFLAACLAIAFNFSGFFLYPLSAPAFLLRHLGVSEREFLWLFGPAMAGMMFGSWLSGHLAGKISARATICRGFLVMTMAAAANVTLNLVLPPMLPWAILPIFAYTIGMALTMPSLTLLALDLFPAQRGLAASCQSFLQSAVSSLTAGIIAPLIWGSALTLSLGMSGLLFFGVVSSLSYGVFAMRRTPS